MSPQSIPAKSAQPVRRHLLIIERETAKRQALYDALSRRRFTVYTARSAEMVLTVLGYERPDVVLLDPHLPDMNGSQLIAQIRACNPAVPILLLDDGHAGQLIPDAQDAIQALLPLTITDEQLLAEIDRWMAHPTTAALPRSAGAVLLIDDEERMRIIMQNLLELNGFTVLTACSGEEGLMRLGRGHLDAVILDVRLPGMDGLLVLKKIRETLPTLPVILVTQVDDEATREEAMRLGATAYVTKPFNFDGLKQALRQAMPGASTKSPASSASG